MLRRSAREAMMAEATILGETQAEEAFAAAHAVSDPADGEAAGDAIADAQTKAIRVWLDALARRGGKPKHLARFEAEAIRARRARFAELRGKPLQDA